MKQRAGALRYMGLRAPARCTTRLARGICSKQGAPPQASRGPKKLGRSAWPGLLLLNIFQFVLEEVCEGLTLGRPAQIAGFESSGYSCSVALEPGVP